jgi:hypothetical protein
MARAASSEGSATCPCVRTTEARAGARCVVARAETRDAIATSAGDVAAAATGGASKPSAKHATSTRTKRATCFDARLTPRT